MQPCSKRGGTGQEFVPRPEAKSVFTSNQHTVTKQSSDPRRIHEVRRVAQRAHLSLPLIIQDIISRKWQRSKMWEEDTTPTLCSTWRKKVAYRAYILITFPLTIYRYHLSRYGKIDDKKGNKFKKKKHCQHPGKVTFTLVEKNTWECPQCVTGVGRKVVKQRRSDVTQVSEKRGWW